MKLPYKLLLRFVEERFKVIKSSLQAEDKEAVIAPCNQVIEAKINKLSGCSRHGDLPSSFLNPQANHLEVNVFTR